jgi:hypothetical protein
MNVQEHYLTERQQSLRITRSDTVPPSLVRAALEQHRNRHVLGVVLKEGKRSSVTLLRFPWEGKQYSLCCKQYSLPTWPIKLRASLLPSRSRRSFDAARHFLQAGIQTARPLAVIEKRCCGILQESFFLMEDISSLPGMPEYIARNFSPPLSKDLLRRKKQFIEDFARFLREVHQKGVYQTDFKTTNIFVEEFPGGTTGFWLVDLDQVVFSRRVSLRRRLKNLCQLNTSLPAVITLEDRLRFYRSYWEKTRLDTRDRKVIAEILRASQKRNPHWHPRFRMDADQIRGWQ